MKELSQSGAPVFGQVQPHWRCGLLGQNESQVSSEGWQLRLWLSPMMLTQTFSHSHIKCCPLLRGENEGCVSHRVPWEALWSVTWRDVGMWSGTANIQYTCTVYQSFHDSVMNDVQRQTTAFVCWFGSVGFWISFRWSSLGNTAHIQSYFRLEPWAEISCKPPLWTETVTDHNIIMLFLPPYSSHTMPKLYV